MIFWAAAFGALIGWALADFESFGLYIGAFTGGLAGLWLRSAVRHEVNRGIARALAALPDRPAQPHGTAPAAHADGPPSMPDVEPAPPLPEPAVEEPEPRRDPAPLSAGSPIPSRAAWTPPAREPAEPALFAQWIEAARAWLLGGNTIVRVGLVILFVGLSFLARYAVAAGLFPIELRLALVAAVGVALLAIGFQRRLAKPEFALALQGAGVAVLYLTVFAAAKFFDVMPPGAAFGFMILFAALGCALALLQDAKGLALASFAGGFAVPLLLGGQSPTPVPLFGYFTVLNLAILFIAWKRAWRSLNLLGFFATFGMATLWGMTTYQPQHYLACQIFLGLSVAIYLAAAVFYAHNTPGKLGNAVDSTLLFGPAVAGFGLEAGLVHHIRFGTAFAALAFGAVYVGVAAFTMRQRRGEMRLLNECLLAIGIGFVTLAVPLALDVRWTSAAWALEGAGAFWVGARQARWMPRLFGLVLQGVAALLMLQSAGMNISAMPIANHGFFGPMLIALPLLFTAWVLRRELPHSGSHLAQAYASAERLLSPPAFLAGFASVCLGLAQEATRHLPAATADGWPLPAIDSHLQPLVIMLLVLAAMAFADWFGRKQHWPVATWPARASLPLLALVFLVQAIDGHRVLYTPDWIAWALALAGHFALLRRSDRAEPSRQVQSWNFAMHAGGVWLVTAMLADGLYLGIDRAALWDTSWSGVIFLVSAVAVLMGLTRWAGRAAPLVDTSGLGWPLHPQARAYWWVAALPLALIVFLGALGTELFAEGVTDPLPYIPLLNPVDLALGLALVALELWRRMAVSAAQPTAAGEMLAGRPALIAGGLLAFAMVNSIWLRVAHHWLGVEWSASAFGDSPVVQTGLAILWTLLAMGLMIFAHRHARRVAWLIGAGLLVVVVAKLLLIDMSRAQSWERIVTFIGVGALMLVIGYFVPLPPRKDTGEQGKPA
ncbi:MAG: DUF2339 domain-containing protein [Sphingomonadales bacterium]|nr:DUF2339 domain-containing protein [Sphingomonadales bacterium]